MSNLAAYYAYAERVALAEENNKNLRHLLGEQEALALRYLARAEKAEAERDGYLAGYETELIVHIELEEERDAHRAEVARLRGLLHTEMICTMHYCETCEMAYQRPEGCAPSCPYCEVERLRQLLGEQR